MVRRRARRLRARPRRPGHEGPGGDRGRRGGPPRPLGLAAGARRAEGHRHRRRGDGRAPRRPLALRGATRSRRTPTSSSTRAAARCSSSTAGASTASRSARRASSASSCAPTAARATARCRAWATTRCCGWRRCSTRLREQPALEPTPAGVAFLSGVLGRDVGPGAGGARARARGAARPLPAARRVPGRADAARDAGADQGQRLRPRQRDPVARRGRDRQPRPARPRRGGGARAHRARPRRAGRAGRGRVHRDHERERVAARHGARGRAPRVAGRGRPRGDAGPERHARLLRQPLVSQGVRLVASSTASIPSASSTCSRPRRWSTAPTSGRRSPTSSSPPASTSGSRGGSWVAEPEQLRLGGMALRNGLLVHGPTSWAIAVRNPAGEIEVASGPKPTFVRGRARADPVPARTAAARRGDGRGPARPPAPALGPAAARGRARPARGGCRDGRPAARRASSPAAARLARRWSP